MTATGSLARAMECLQALLAQSTVLQARFLKTEQQLKDRCIQFGEEDLDADAEPGEELPDSYIVLIEASHGYGEYANSGSHRCLQGQGGILAVIVDKPRQKLDKAAHLDFTDFVSQLIDDIAGRIVPANDVPFRTITLMVRPHRTPVKNRKTNDVQSAMYLFTWGVPSFGNVPLAEAGE